MECVKYAQKIMEGKKSDADKIKAIYSFMIQNIKYDWDVYNKLPNTYLPNIENTYKTKKGICYDYSSLTASLLRSLGYPTRLVKGYTKLVEGYHAWNEIYMNNKWVIVDTTVDSSMKDPVFSKDKAQYSPSGYF
jgi:transglutaminase-like putative cysteine protease